MEALTKSQIVLLTLLVSFVTSIATGITTVALMDQAPPAITQTINRVVEHTVERVVPAESQQAAAATSVTTEQTVIVKQSDAIASAVAGASPSIVRISLGEDVAPSTIGVAITGSTIVTDSAIVKDGTQYFAILSDGKVIPLEKNPVISGSLVMFTTVSGTSTPTLTPIATQRTIPQLGETTIALTGLRTPRISNGIITSVLQGTTATTTEQTTPIATSFETSIDLGPLAAGSVFISTEGALTGIYTSAKNTITPASLVSQLRSSKSDTENN